MFIRESGNVMSKRLLSLFLTCCAFFAHAQEIQHTPESTTRALYQELKIQQFSPASITALRQFVDPDAIMTFGTNIEDSRQMDIEQFFKSMQSIAQDNQKLLRNIQRDINHLSCAQSERFATCLISVNTLLPELNDQPYTSDETVTLQYKNGRWMIITATWRVLAQSSDNNIMGFPLVPSSYPIAPNKLKKVSRQWDRVLPFYGQQVYEMGFDLPLPFGVSIIPNWNSQHLTIDNLDVAFNDGPVSNIDFVNFGEAVTHTGSLQVKFDAWLFPFLNVYATLGKIDGHVDVPLSFRLDDVTALAGLDICEGKLAPDFCLQRINGQVRANIDTKNASIGMAPVIGYKNFFFSLPMTYSWTFIDAIEGSPVTTTVISPRVGITFEAEKNSRLSAYIGATYMKSNSTITNDFTFRLPSDLPVVGGNDLKITYKVTETVIDPWNFVVGANWDINNKLAVQLEAATGGSRNQVVTSVTWRF